MPRVEPTDLGVALQSSEHELHVLLNGAHGAKRARNDVVGQAPADLAQARQVQQVLLQHRGQKGPHDERVDAHHHGVKKVVGRLALAERAQAEDVDGEEGEEDLVVAKLGHHVVKRVEVGLRRKDEGEEEELRTGVR